MKCEKKYKCDFLIFNQENKQADRVGKLDESMQKQICKFHRKNFQKTLWM